MSYLIDTNVLSELRRKTPDRGVLTWFMKRPASTLYLSVLTLGELRKGIDTITDLPRKQTLSDWLEIELPAFFMGRVLDIDQSVADTWGRIMAAANRPLPSIDSLLAATAITHRLTMVTRNTKDFVGLSDQLEIVNPWVESVSM